MAKKAKPTPTPSAPAALSSLGDLLKQRGVRVDDAPAPAAPLPAQAQPTVDEFGLSGCGKLVVRRERKGHGGKTATVIDGLNLPPSKLDALARALRIAFGCGSRVEGSRVVLQGERAPAVETWLRQRGARQVVIGN